MSPAFILRRSQAYARRPVTMSFNRVGRQPYGVTLMPSGTVGDRASTYCVALVVFGLVPTELSVVEQERVYTDVM